MDLHVVAAAVLRKVTIRPYERASRGNCSSENRQTLHLWLFTACNHCVQSCRRRRRSRPTSPYFTQQTGGLTWASHCEELQHAPVNQGQLCADLLGNRIVRSGSESKTLPGEHCVQHATVQFRCARRSLGKEDGIKLKPFVKDPAGSQSRPERLASHPEASLAWWWGNPPCEA
jgi:hypothetical protein